MSLTNNTMRDVLVGLGDASKRINEKKIKQWNRGKTKFIGLIQNERRKRLGIRLDTLRHTTREEVARTTDFGATLRAASSIPANFNSLSVWPLLKSFGVWDQGQCGDCWAVSAVTVLTYRSAINGLPLLKLSPQPLVSWCTSLPGISDVGTGPTNGCDGSDLQTPWNFLEQVGTVPLSVMPMPSSAGPSACPSVLQNPIKAISPPDGYDITGTQSLTTNRQAIQAEIMARGPVQAAFTVYEDLMQYTGGVYSPSQGSSIDGGHAIVIIGWGVSENNIPYWIIQNSWGADWGETFDGQPGNGTNGGFFRMEMHTAASPLPPGNITSVEMNAYAGYAASGTPKAPVVTPTPSPSPSPTPPPAGDNNNPKKSSASPSLDYKTVAIYGGVGIVIFLILFILIVREKNK